MSGLRGPVVVTGTDTGVGKTIVTAAIAAAATAAGLRVAMIKPAQTGIPEAREASGEPDAEERDVEERDVEEPDAQTVARLAAPATTRTLVSYPEPLAPATAARVAGRPTLSLASALDAVRQETAAHDLVLIEGAGGLLVSMGDWTLADLLVELQAPAVLVARAGLGTLNHTALTLEALDRRGVEAYVVIGAWPAQPELVHRMNLVDLPGRLVGIVPEGAGALEPSVFRERAPEWLAPTLHGRLVVSR